MRIDVVLTKQDAIDLLFDGYDTPANAALGGLEAGGLLNMALKRAGDEIVRTIEPDDDMVATALSEALDAVRERYLGKPGHIKVPARVVCQVWHGDYAEDVKEERFDASFALDELELADIEGIRPDVPDYDSDEVFHRAAALGLVPDWDGPFSVYIDDEDAFRAYLDARHSQEAGRMV